MVTKKQRDKNNSEKLPARRRGDNLPKFEKGTRNPGSGRKKGQPNFFTREIKEAIIAAANTGGDIVCSKTYDKKVIEKLPGLATLKEYGGLHGYLTHLSVFEPKSFASLLGKVLPIQIVSKEEEQRTVVYRTFKEVQEDLKNQGVLIDLKTSEYVRKGDD